MNRSIVCLLLIITGTLAATVYAQDKKPKTTGDHKPPTATAHKPPTTAPAVVEPPDRSVLLVRDPLIQKELALKPDQIKPVGELMDATDAQLWKVNPLPAAEGAEKARQILTGAEAKLKPILTADQRARFRQISIQYQGLPAVLRPDLAPEFNLTDDQRHKIRAETDKTLRAFTTLDQMRRLGQPREIDEKTAGAVRTDLRAKLRTKILDILNDDQKTHWTLLVGKPFDFTKGKPPDLRAPELVNAGQWINSQPLTLAGLRGHVVVVHFYTFGCENCIHNYPAYKAWMTTLVPKGVTIIGIHTPETAAEHDLAQVQAKAKADGLKFPILVDSEKKNWDAWGNGVWPAVYVVDKHGYVRYWWFGELNSEKVQGQTVMAKLIEGLLTEDTAPAAPTADSTGAPRRHGDTENIKN